MILGLIALAGLLGLRLGTFFPTGAFHDDAIYWLLSRSLQAGGYSLASDPLGSPVVNYLPGYPLFLAVAALPDNIMFARGLSWACLLAAWILAARILKNSLGPAMGTAVLAWFAFQPALLRYSTSLLSEPLYILVLLGAFHCYGFLRERPSLRGELLLSLLLGYACWVRPMGIFIGPALALDAGLRRRWRQAGLFLLGPLLFQGAFSLWTSAQARELSSFWGQWRFSLAGAPDGTLASVVLANLAHYADYLAFMTYFPLGKWGAALQGAPAALWAARGLSAAVLVYGGYRAVRSGGPARAAVCYFLLHTGLIAFWLRPDPRYVLPLVFFALWFAGLTLQRVPAVLRRASLGVALALCLATGLRWAAAHEKQKFPAGVFQDAKDLLPAGAVTAVQVPATFYLYAGFRGMDFPKTYQPEEFLGRLLERGVTHVLAEDPPAASARVIPDVNDWSAPAAMMLSQAGWYRALRRWEDPGFTLYAVIVDPARYLEAYALYRRGLQDWERGDRAGAEIQFKSALERQPDMTGALDRLAYAALLAGRRGEAGRLLRAALAAWPEMPLTRYHFYQWRRGGGEDAGADLALARAAAERYRYWPLLRRLEQDF